MSKRLLGLLLLCIGLGVCAPAQAARCLLITSYNTGYEWNDGIAQGVRSVLAGKCDLTQFNMDTKVHPSAAFAQAQGLKARQLIERLHPDIVIASDDNASRYVVMPFYKNARIPFVFCGVNWEVGRYGYPYRNATGMVEVAPIKPLLAIVRATISNPRRVTYLAPDSETEHIDFEHYRKVYAEAGIQVRGVFVKTLRGWQQGYLRAQQDADFIILGNNAGINDWSRSKAAHYALAHARKLTVSNYDWMQPYTMLAMTKIANEQGEWAAKVALRILSGVSPQRIPITPNRRWAMYVNLPLLKKAGIHLPASILNKAVKYHP